MKLFKRVLSIATVLSLSAVLLVAPTATYAAGESREDAQAVTIGQKVKEEVTEKTSVWYKFTAAQSADSWHRLGAICKEGYYYFRLYNEDGDEIMKFTSDANHEGLDYIKLEPGKEYYVKMEFSVASAYTVYVEEIKDNAPETDEGALNLLSGIKYTGNLECVSDTDYFTFTAGATKTTVNLTLKYNDNYALLAVLNEDGAELKKMSIDNNRSESISIDTVKGEKYFIKTFVGSVKSNSKSSGQYIINVKSGSTDINNLIVDDIVNKAGDVYIFNGKTRLVKGTDYTLTVGTVKLGKASVTIKGKGGYTGSVVKECTVVAK